MRALLVLAFVAAGCTVEPLGAFGAPCVRDGDCATGDVCRELPTGGSFCLPPGAPDAGVVVDAGEPDAGAPDAGEPDAGEPDAGPDAGPLPCVADECAAGTVCTEVIGIGTRCLTPTAAPIRIERSGFYALPGVRGAVPGTNLVILHPRLGSLPVVSGCAPGTNVCIHAGEL